MDIKLINNDCLIAMPKLLNDSINLIVTSPPYNMRTRVRNGKYTTRERSEHFSKKYKKALENYRLFLDRNGIRLPPIKYPIFKNYKNTFKYLDAIIKDNYGRFEFVQMIHNPNWIYKKMDLKNNNNQ
jgi:DNA modification methylase